MSHRFVPSPSPDGLRGVCGLFSAHTTAGSDNLHPALHLEHVCDNALRAIVMIMALAANIGYCPAVFATIIMVLLPKATGGWRPIGLFTGMLRVYLRWTRRAVTSSWERDFSRPYWFGQTAHTCQHATWPRRWHKPRNFHSDSDVPQNMARHASSMWIPPCSSFSDHVSLQVEAASCVPYMPRSSRDTFPGFS